MTLLLGSITDMIFTYINWCSLNFCNLQNQVNYPCRFHVNASRQAYMTYARLLIKHDDDMRKARACQHVLADMGLRWIN